MSAQHWVNGVLRYWEDDATRTVYVYGTDGKETSRTPYTAELNAAADVAQAEVTSRTNEATIRDRARQALQANAAAITQLEQFAAGSASLTNTQRDNYLRQLAQHQARAFKELNALIKLELRDLTSTDGT